MFLGWKGEIEQLRRDILLFLTIAKLPAKLAFPVLAAFVSVPDNTIPASNFSRTS